MQRVLFVMAICLCVLAQSCTKQSNPVSPSLAEVPSAYPSHGEALSNGLIFGPSQDTASPNQGKGRRIEPTTSGVTYASAVIPWHDNIEGDDDWMAIFYLPYQPAIVNFYGLLWMGYWANFNGWVRLHDARWTSSGFRVMIFMGDKVTINCGTSPNRYRLGYSMHLF